MATVHHTVATVLSNVRQEVSGIGTQVARYQGHMTLHERQFREECRALRTTQVQVLARQDTIFSQMKIMQQQQQQMLLLMQQQQQPLPLVAVVAEQQSIVDGDTAGVAFAGVDPEEETTATATATATERRSNTTTATRFAQKQGLHAFNTMHQSDRPREPRLSKKFPECWNALVEEWRLCDLQSFRSSKTKKWETATRQRYSKRLRAMQQLRKFQQEVGIDDEFKVAETLDAERDNRKLTLTTHYDFLVKNDATIMRRKRKSRDELL